MAMMTYPATVQFLYGLQQHGIKLGLETIRALLARVGDPHRGYPVVHIGGTNGKGSTAAMTASMLQAAGHRVGLYTSPHLVDFRERIRVDGVMIPEARVSALVEVLREAAAPDLAPTFLNSRRRSRVDILRSVGWMWRCSKSDWVGDSMPRMW